MIDWLIDKSPVYHCEKSSNQKDINVTSQPWPRLSRLDPSEWNKNRTTNFSDTTCGEKFRISLIQVKVKFIHSWAQQLTNTLGGVGWQENIHFSRRNWLWFWTCFKWCCIDCGSKRFKIPKIMMWFDLILIFESELGLILTVEGPDLVWVWYSLWLWR